MPGGAAPPGQTAVAVVVVHEHHERPLAPHEEGGGFVAGPLGGLGQRLADRPDPLQRSHRSAGATPSLTARKARGEPFSEPRRPRATALAIRRASMASSRNIPLIGLVSPVKYSPGASGAVRAPWTTGGRARPGRRGGRPAAPARAGSRSPRSPRRARSWTPSASRTSRPVEAHRPRRPARPCRPAPRRSARRPGPGWRPSRDPRVEPVVRPGQPVRRQVGHADPRHAPGDPVDRRGRQVADQHRRCRWAGQPATSRGARCAGGVRTASRTRAAPPSTRSTAISAPVLPTPTTSTSRPCVGLRGCGSAWRAAARPVKSSRPGQSGQVRRVVVAGRDDHGARPARRRPPAACSSQRAPSARPVGRSMRCTSTPVRDLEPWCARVLLQVADDVVARPTQRP